jgi:secreted trypsin-like serine protease
VAGALAGAAALALGVPAPAGAADAREPARDRAGTGRPAAAAASVGAQRPATARAAVVGGRDARAGKYPWIVALSVGCAGTLIAPDRVLTAGHCVEDLRASQLRLYVGARMRTKGGYRYDGRAVRAVDIATHPGYRSLANGGPVRDAALIRLEQPVEDVPLVRLATPADAVLTADGRPATVIGWGVTRTDPERGRLALALQEGGLRILSDRSCGRVYGADGSYRRSVMLCARSRSLRRRPNTSPCVGDSGGPLLSGGVQVGIVSFGISCGTLSEPTVFARVAALREFIDAPEPVWAPQPLGRPTVRGTVAPGHTVVCEPPAFRGEVTRIRYRWGIDGALVATGRRVRITSNARGKVLQCRAVAENAGGRTPSATSPPIRVGDAADVAPDAG